MKSKDPLKKLIKLDKPLVKLTIKKRKDTNYSIRNERGEFVINSVDIKRRMGNILKFYFCKQQFKLNEQIPLKIYRWLTNT